MTITGPVTKLQRSFAYRLARWFPSEMLRWMDVVSSAIDNITGGTQLQERWVNKGGSDTTGDGSFDKPFLTVAAAMTSITDADTVAKPYVIWVSPGIYTDVFTVKPGVYVEGSGSGAPQYVGAPLTAATILAPNPAQVLNAGFAGAGSKSGGIAHCAFSTAFVANFNAIGSTGAGTFYLEDILTEFAITFTGVAAGNTGNVARLKDIYVNQFVDITIANMGGSEITDLCCDFGGGLVYTQSAPIVSFHNIIGALINSFSATWTSALIANNMNINAEGISAQFITQVTLTGKGISLTAPGVDRSVVMSDAANRMAWGNDNAATIVGIGAGRNIIYCTPTASRLLTIAVQPSGLNITEIRVTNLALATFNVDFTFTGGAIAPGSPTYVPPGATVDIFFDPNKGGAGTWTVVPYVQKGATAVAGGVSALIPADVTARSSFLATLTTYNGVPGVPKITNADLVVGTRAGGGGFKIHSIALATGTDVATDNGTYFWLGAA
jgi:hypothetical protein